MLCDLRTHQASSLDSYQIARIRKLLGALILNLTTLKANSAVDKLTIFFLFYFSENTPWLSFMQIVSIRDMIYQNLFSVKIIQNVFWIFYSAC